MPGLSLSKLGVGLKPGVVSSTPINLSDTPADNLGFTVNSSTANGISLTGATTRNHIVWPADALPIGTRIQMDINSPTSKQIIVRLNNNLNLLGSPNEIVFDDTFSGDRSVDYTTTQSLAYFGFLTLESGDVTITNLVITLP